MSGRPTATPVPTPVHEVEHVSFDVFDTAVCRLVHAPAHLHLGVGRRLRARGLVDLTDAQWAYARSEAEFRRRQTVTHREVDLAEIYDELAELLGMDRADARAARETEVLEEHRLVRPIATTRARVAALVRAGTPPLFLSDTYLPSAEVASLLARAGYERPLDVVVSCEQRASKLAGTLFDHVAGQRGLDGSRVRHVGDNLSADVHGAASRGWNATHFPDSQWTARERVIFASGTGDFVTSAVAGSARAARLGQAEPVAGGIASAAATVVGPMFAAYVLWVLRDVVARGGRTIHFLARDGQVLVPICARLARWLGVEVRAVYTYASRQAYLLAALPDGGPEMVDEAVGLAWYDRVTLSGALSSLRFTADEVAALTEEAGLAADLERTDARDGELAALRDTLRRPVWLDLLRARAEAARGASLAYLESVGLFRDPEASIVDLGWRGTTQLRLQKAVGTRVTLVGYYLGLTDTVLPPEARTRVWTGSPAIKTGLLEVMASADHTSVRGFELDGTGEPICVPPVAEDTDMVTWGARAQQEIATRFVDHFTDAVELEHHAVDDVSDALESAARAAYRHFRMSPSSEEAEAYGGVLHSDDVNHVARRPLARPVSSRDVVRHLLGRSPRAEVTSWYLGSVARSRDHLLPALISAGIDRAIVVPALLRTRCRRVLAARSARRSLADRGVGDGGRP